MHKKKQFPFQKFNIARIMFEKKNFPARIVLKACRLVSGQAIETTTAPMGNIIGRKRNTPSNCFTCCSTDTGANRPCNDHKCPTGLGKVVYCFPFMTFILFWCAIYTPNAYTEQIKVVLEFSIQATLLLFSIWYVLKHFDLILKKKSINVISSL